MGTHMGGLGKKRVPMGFLALGFGRGSLPMGPICPTLGMLNKLRRL